MQHTKRKILKPLTNITTERSNWILLTLSITQINLLFSMNRRCTMNVSKYAIKLLKWDEKTEQIMILLPSKLIITSPNVQCYSQRVTMHTASINIYYVIVAICKGLIELLNQKCHSKSYPLKIAS